jgi:acyl carrier protein
MTYEEIMSEVRRISAEVLRVPVEKAHEDAKYVEDLHVDSLFMVELAVAMEERFEITVPEEEVRAIASVRQMADFVKGKLAEAEA